MQQSDPQYRGKISVDVNTDDVVLGFPVPQAGRVVCQIGTPIVKNSKSGKPMIVFPLIPMGDIACTVYDENGNQSTKNTGSGKPLLQVFASLTPEALKVGTLKQIELAARLKGAVWQGQEINLDNLPQFVGKTILAVVVNRTGDNGKLQANVNEVFPA